MDWHQMKKKLQERISANYSILWYKNTKMAAVRQKFGDKKQIFQWREKVQLRWSSIEAVWWHCFRKVRCRWIWASSRRIYQKGCGAFLWLETGYSTLDLCLDIGKAEFIWKKRYMAAVCRLIPVMPIMNVFQHALIHRTSVILACTDVLQNGFSR